MLCKLMLPLEAIIKRDDESHKSMSIKGETYQLHRKAFPNIYKRCKGDCKWHGRASCVPIHVVHAVVQFLGPFAVVAIFLTLRVIRNPCGV